MVIKDDYNKDFLILDEENLIYKRLFKKVKIKRSDIRSIFYGENILGVLTYSGKVYSFNIVKLLYSERYKLEDLRKELNKEKILFNYTSNIYNNYIYIIFIINPIMNNIRNIWGISMLILLIVFIFIAKYYNRSIIFNIDKDELEVKIGRKFLKYKRYEIDKIKIIKHTTRGNIINFFKNGNKYTLYFEDTPYLIKNYGVGLNKLFNIV